MAQKELYGLPEYAAPQKEGTMTDTDTNDTGDEWEPYSGDLIILCDFCLTPINPKDAESEGARDYHPDCPHRRMTSEEATAEVYGRPRHRR